MISIDIFVTKFDVPVILTTFCYKIKSMVTGFTPINVQYNVHNICTQN